MNVYTFVISICIYLNLRNSNCFASMDITDVKWIHNFASDSYVLNLSSDGPAVLDAPIRFYANISYNSGKKVLGTYYFRYQDYDRITHLNQTEPKESPTATWTLTYNSSLYNARVYRIHVQAVRQYFYSDVTVAQAELYYNITDFLNGHLEVYQYNPNRTESNDIATNENTEFQLYYYDPSNYLKSATEIIYFWWVDYVNYGPSKESVYTYNFTSATTYTVQVIVQATFNTSGGNGNGLNYITKLGVFTTDVIAKDPILDFNYTGLTWLKHGDLLDLHITCEGTAPFSYCWDIKPGGYNVTGNESCPISPTVTNVCEFYVIHYFAISKSYTIRIVIDNDVSHDVRIVPVNIYEVNRKRQLSVIVIPMTCTVFAVIIVVFGIAYYIQNRNKFTIEVADFDFGRIEHMEFKSFYERIRDTLTNKFRRNPRSEDKEPLFNENDASAHPSLPDES